MRGWMCVDGHEVAALAIEQRVSTVSDWNPPLNPTPAPPCMLEARTWRSNRYRYLTRFNPVSPPRGSPPPHRPRPPRAAGLNFDIVLCPPSPRRPPAIDNARRRGRPPRRAGDGAQKSAGKIFDALWMRAVNDSPGGALCQRRVHSGGMIQER
jgi:hypothetical protein